MARIWNTPVFILATAYFIVDGVFSYVTRPITAWIAKEFSSEHGAGLFRYDPILHLRFCSASTHSRAEQNL